MCVFVYTIDDKVILSRFTRRVYAYCLSAEREQDLVNLISRLDRREVGVLIL